MLQRFRARFGTAGLIVAVLAVVVALTGTAIAAGGLTATQKKQVVKIAKQYAGQDGAPGAQGAAGANGKDGAAGTPGTPGQDGQPGAAGKSVQVGTESTGTANCEGRGGVTVKVEGSATTKYACNGAEGPPGPTETTLPSEEMVTGLWSFDEKGAASALVTISYPMRVEPAITPGNVHWVNGPDPECPGSVEAPKANPGYLCIYQANLSNASLETVSFARGDYTPDRHSGFTFELVIPGGGEGYGWGSWAVTAQ
jgi:hypothetical protein